MQPSLAHSFLTATDRLLSTNTIVCLCVDRPLFRLVRLPPRNYFTELLTASHMAISSDETKMVSESGAAKGGSMGLT